jgi:hypothetical protein
MLSFEFAQCRSAGACEGVRNTRRVTSRQEGRIISWDL